jgi:hypothetical protein
MQTISCIGFMQHASALKAAGKLGDAFAARRAVFAKCKAAGLLGQEPPA